MHTHIHTQHTHTTHTHTTHPHTLTHHTQLTRVQQELMEQDKEKQAKGAQRRHTHAEEVRKQVREKEEGKIAARRAFFEEGIKLDHEAQER